MIKVGIVGGTGYTGVELLRLLARHPQVELKAITSRKEAGMPVAEMFPNLRGRVQLAFSTPEEAGLENCDVVFFATPNGVAMQQTRALLDAGVRVVDLAADFRIKDISVWEQWYKMEHACPDLVAEAVYGLPEINREKIKGARLIANPGCYPTAVALWGGIRPTLRSDHHSRRLGGLIFGDERIAQSRRGSDHSHAVFCILPAEVILAGGIPVELPTCAEDGFQLRTENLIKAITPHTKAILLGYPNNPTGAVYTRERLLEIAQLAEAHDLIVISDELYDQLVYGVTHVCFASLPGMQERIVLLGGFSKNYAMTGWRAGYAAAPADILRGLLRVHQYTIMSARKLSSRLRSPQATNLLSKL